jgi:glucosamine-6-phosphate deaminase
MGRVMARELVDLVAARNAEGRETRVIVPCGPSGWYAPWTEMVNARGVSLARLTVFHMDECLDWQGRPLPKGHPYNFRTFMERHFYGGIRPELDVPEDRRFWLLPSTMERVRDALAEAPVDLALGGWGQDGHVAYNQARRHPLLPVGLEELAASTIRVQENNLDTILALAQRTFGTAWQFVPPMSVTLGMRECLSASKVRVFSDTGSWKQTALRVALFSEPVPEYPMTLLQRHPDALVTATRETARHPISEHPEWELL